MRDDEKKAAFTVIKYNVLASKVIDYFQSLFSEVCFLKRRRNYAVFHGFRVGMDSHLKALPCEQ